ncbi:MAG: FecR family protein [Methylocystis sp.]
MSFNFGWRRACASLLLVAAGALSGAAALADENIGVASVVRNEVSGVLPSGNVQISAGESVVRDEVVKTAVDSSTKLVFTDSTNLAIGPKSSVKLSNFVAAGPSNYGKATIDVAKGVFRFSTGHSDKRAYEINTGVATIGVRGTVFEGEREPSRTRIRVVNGVVIVHTRGGKICELRAGQSAIISEFACTPVVGFDPSFQFFAEQCASGGGLCDVQEFAQVQPGEPSFFGLDNPAMFIAPAAGIGGAVAGGVAAGVSNSASADSSSQRNQSIYLLLLNSASRSASP